MPNTTDAFGATSLLCTTLLSAKLLVLMPTVSGHHGEVMHFHQRKSTCSHTKKKKPLPTAVIHTNAVMRRFLQKSMHIFLLHQQCEHDNIIGHKLKIHVLFYAST